ncbi:MAG: YceI family protein [Microscillaceae bacterium]|nr:YceI family protein [Microscillaceae bacterium]
MSVSVEAQTRWKVQPGAKVTFKIKNAGFNVDGSFSGISANILFEAGQLAQSSIEASIKANTINTGITARDNHLRRSDYFYVEKYPLIKVNSQKIIKQGNQYLGYFNLSIREVSKSIEIPFTFSQSGDQAVFSGSFTLNRRDYNVGGWSMVLGNEVQIFLQIPVEKE